MITSQKQFDKAIKEAQNAIKVNNSDDLKKYLKGLPFIIANKELQLAGVYTCKLNGVNTMFYV